MPMPQDAIIPAAESDLRNALDVLPPAEIARIIREHYANECDSIHVQNGNGFKTVTFYASLTDCYRIAENMIERIYAVFGPVVL